MAFIQTPRPATCQIELFVRGYCYYWERPSQIRQGSIETKGQRLRGIYIDCCAKKALDCRLDNTCDRRFQMSRLRTQFVVHFFVASAFIFGGHAVAKAQSTISDV